VDYVAREARNAALGKAGEKLVRDKEIHRLRDAGRKDLAPRVRWVSQEDGDGLGYDIQSFEEDGNAIFLEVKTTRQGITTGFFLSSNELQASVEFGEAFRLHRVFNFGRNPQYYVLSGPLSESCLLEVSNYRAWPSGSSLDS